ncbi:MAG TPA: aldo/keto reductase [Steroidobacteraceae bacterium]|nr:aldo/keto reductase [Steroidobacteraceae bacterium]
MRIPRILYGTAWKKTDTERLVALSIGHGFRGIDTACQPKHYDEPGVGAALAACYARGLTRADLYLQTKFTPVSGQDAGRMPYDPQAPLADQVAQSFAASLRNLRTDHLDCLLLHSPLPTPAETLQVWRAFERIADAGGIRQAGISNCYALAELQELYRAASIKPAVLQNRFYADTGYDRDLRAFCRQQGIVYQSFWTLTANPQLLAHAAITALASAHRRTPAQILFRYLTQAGIVPLTGTRSAAHMREDLGIFDFELSAADCGAIDRLLAD